MNCGLVKSKYKFVKVFLAKYEEAYARHTSITVADLESDEEKKSDKFFCIIALDPIVLSIFKYGKNLAKNEEKFCVSNFFLTSDYSMTCVNP